MEGMRFSVPGGLGRLLSIGEIWVPARDKLDHSLINDYNRQLCSVGAPGVHLGGGVLSLSQNKLYLSPKGNLSQAKCYSDYVYIDINTLILILLRLFNTIKIFDYLNPAKVIIEVNTNQIKTCGVFLF